MEEYVHVYLLVLKEMKTFLYTPKNLVDPGTV